MRLSETIREKLKKALELEGKKVDQAKLAQKLGIKTRDVRRYYRRIVLKYKRPKRDKKKKFLNVI